jgi:hypothetical protein
MPLGVYIVASDSVLEPGGAYPVGELSTLEAPCLHCQSPTHVYQFSLKYHEHQALLTTHDAKTQRDIRSMCSARRTLYAHNANGRPRNAERTNQPDGASELGWRRPAVRRVFDTASGKRELEVDVPLTLRYVLQRL